MSLLRTTVITAAPKLIAVLRDLLLLRYYGLGPQLALITTLIYATHFLSTVISTGVLATAIENRGFRNIRLDTILLISITIISIPYLAIYLSKLESKQFEFHTIDLILSIIISLVASKIVLFNAYFIANNKTKENLHIFLLDAVPALSVIIFLLFLNFNITNFLCILLSGLLISMSIYGTATTKITKSRWSTPESTKKSFFAIIKISVFMALMSTTNIIDQILLGGLSLKELSLYNIIQRYTFVLAGVGSLIFLRQYASIMENNTKAINFKHASYAVVILISISVLIITLSQIQLVNNKYIQSILSAVFASAIQIPYFILLSLYLVKSGSNLSILQKVMVAAPAIAIKYLFLIISGISAYSIFISHGILNAVALLVFHIILTRKNA